MSNDFCPKCGMKNSKVTYPLCGNGDNTGCPWNLPISTFTALPPNATHFIHDGELYDLVGTDDRKCWAEVSGQVEAKGFDMSECILLRRKDQYLSSLPDKGAEERSAEEVLRSITTPEGAQKFAREWGWDAIVVDKDAAVQAMQSYASTQSAEIQRLRDWKESMISVTPDMQAIGKALNVPLGQSVHDKILPGIKQLQSENKSLRDEAERLRGALTEIVNIKRKGNEDWKYPFNRAWNIAHSALTPNNNTDKI